MLRFCYFFCFDANSIHWPVFLHTPAPLTCQSAWNTLRITSSAVGSRHFDVYQLNPHLRLSVLNSHVIDAIMRCGFQLNEKLLLQENTGFLKASKIITHPCVLVSSPAAWRPQTWCWNRCGFWFSVKSGPCTSKISDGLYIKIANICLLGLFMIVLYSSYLLYILEHLKRGLNNSLP